MNPKQLRIEDLQAWRLVDWELRGYEVHFHVKNDVDQHETFVTSNGDLAKLAIEALIHGDMIPLTKQRTTRWKPTPGAVATWTLVGPGGEVFQGDSPLKACSEAQKHRITTDAKAYEVFVKAMTDLRQEAHAENDRLVAEHGSLNCPACGGSGHVGDYEDVRERHGADTDLLNWLEELMAFGVVEFTSFDSDATVLGRVLRTPGEPFKDYRRNTVRGVIRAMRDDCAPDTI